MKEYFFISRHALRASILLLGAVLFGSILIFPLVSRLPLVGWDWFYFFNANNPAYNILSERSAYPPFARYIIQLLTWMDWRTSFGVLNSITIMTVALATWKNGGRYFQIVLALATPPVWFLMWVGHPDGLVLLGIVTGILPLVFMKPILSAFAILSDRKLMAWSVALILLSLLLWPGWVFSLRGATMGHETDIGWVKMGWPLLLIGLGLLAGAGKDPYRLMAAGCFITPYLMPYHLALLAPAAGKARRWRQILLWGSAWCVLLGTGLRGPGQYLTFLYPLAVYWTGESFSTYKTNVKENLDNLARLIQRLRRYLPHAVF